MSVANLHGSIVMTARQDAANDTAEQYSLAKILFLWALVTAPMGLFRFVLHPYLMPRVDLHPGILYWWLMIAGMVWQFVLSAIVLRSETSNWQWSKLKARLWLRHPVHPGTGSPYKCVYLYTIPIMVYAFSVEGSGWFSGIESWITSVWPAIGLPSYQRLESVMPLLHEGAWYVLGMALFSSIFNYLLGEELFFRGVLLPRMQGVFGRWAWVANGVLFASYHVHKIAEVPLFIVGSLFYGFLNQRYRSFYPALIIHGIEGVLLIAIILCGLLGFI